MPWGDWQFWLVTGLAGCAVWALVRPLLPNRDEDEMPCSTCAVGSSVKAASQQRR